jgi:hypothetical protein
MKKWIGLILIFSATTFAEEYRTFTTQDGRSLKARITMYDAITGKLQIQREDGKKVMVPVSTFREKDKAYAEKWLAMQTFASESKFKLKITREEVKSTKTEIEMNMDERTGRGAGSGTRIIGSNKNTEYRFVLNMQNGAAVPLENMSIEYRIYYAQEKAVVDEERSKDLPDDRPDIYMAVNEEKVKDGSGQLKPLEAKGEKNIATKPVKLLKRTVNARGMDDQINLDSDLHGIWIKLTMKGPDGTVIRDIAYPPSIPKKFAWDPEEEE